MQTDQAHHALAPTTYAQPAEPPEFVTQLWDRGGCRWERQPVAGTANWQWAAPGQRVPGHWYPDHEGPLLVSWHTLLNHGPLSVDPNPPPAGLGSSRRATPVDLEAIDADLDELRQAAVTWVGQGPRRAVRLAEQLRGEVDRVEALRAELATELEHVQAEYAKTCSNFEEYADGALETAQKLRSEVETFRRGAGLADHADHARGTPDGPAVLERALLGVALADRAALAALHADQPAPAGPRTLDDIRADRQPPTASEPDLADIAAHHPHPAVAAVAGALDDYIAGRDLDDRDEGADRAA